MSPTHRDLVEAGLARAIAAHGQPNMFDAQWLTGVQDVPLSDSQVRRVGRTHPILVITVPDVGRQLCRYSNGWWDCEPATVTRLVRVHHFATLGTPLRSVQERDNAFKQVNEAIHVANLVLDRGAMIGTAAVQQLPLLLWAAEELDRRRRRELGSLSIANDALWRSYHNSLRALSVEARLIRGALRALHSAALDRAEALEAEAATLRTLVRAIP